MKKIARILFSLSVIAAIFSGTASAYEATSKLVKFSINGAPEKEIKTYASTVEEFFKEQEIAVNPYDKVTPPAGTKLYGGSSVTYASYCEVQLVVDGTVKKVPAKKDAPVGFVIADYAKETGVHYIYDEALKDFKVKDGTIIEITSSVQTVEESVADIPFETVTADAPDLPEGTQQITTAGINGQVKTTFEVTHAAGKEVARKTISTEVIQPPVNQVVRIGSAKPVPANANADAVPTQYAQALTMNATAYTVDYNNEHGITASGKKAQVGVVAVDPTVIPLGTKLYIEGYGNAVAGDTGSAIKGHKIDLFFNTYAECVQFGRQDITVYVLA